MAQNEAEKRAWRKKYNSSPKGREAHRAYRSKPKNRLAAAKYYKEWYAKRENRLTSWRHVWANHIRRRYGLSVEAYAWLLYHQNFQCKLCDAPLRFDTPTHSQKVHIDHNKHTSEVRGILCTICNHLALGMIEARGKAWVLRAFDYLGWRE